MSFVNWRRESQQVQPISYTRNPARVSAARDSATSASASEAVHRSCAKYDSMIRSVHINRLNHIDTVWTGMPLTLLALLELFRWFSHSSARYNAYRSLFALEMIGISPKTTVVEWLTSRCDYHHIKADYKTRRPDITTKQSWSSLDVVEVLFPWVAHF